MDGNTARTNDTSAATPARVSFSAVVSRLLTLVTLAVPMLYFCGQKYRESYLGSLGLDESLAPLSSDVYIRLGVESLLGFAVLLIDKLFGQVGWQLILGGLPLLMLATIGRFAYGGLPRLTRTRIEGALRRSRGAIGRTSHGFQWSLTLLFGSWLIALIPVFAILAAFYLMLPAIGTEAVARVQAKELWLQARGLGLGERPQQDFSTVALVDQGSARNAKLIECGTTWCIVFDRDRFVALPKEDIKRIDGVKLNVKP